MKETEAQAKVIFELRRALRAVEAGYTPPFFLMLYPEAHQNNPDRMGVETVMLYNADDGLAEAFYESIRSAAEQFKQQFALAQMNIDPEDFDKMRDGIVSEVEETLKRHLSNLKKDPEVKDTKLAEKMLRELSEKRPN